MADYISKTRTNYFHVKDEQAFRDLMKTQTGVEVWDDRTDDAGRPVFAFGCDGTIPGLPMLDDPDTGKPYVCRKDCAKEACDGECERDEEAFYDALKAHVTKDDAILVFNVGSEKFRYVGGSVVVITSKDVGCVDLTKAGVNAARHLLKNPLWETETSS